MNIKDYAFLYDLLLQVIKEHTHEYVIGRWPLYTLWERSQYPIKQVVKFFHIVLQHNPNLLEIIKQDAQLLLKELKQELESIELVADVITEDTILPEPSEDLVNEMLELLLQDQELSPQVPTTTPHQTQQPTQKEDTYEMISSKFQELDALFDVLQDKLFLHPKFKEMVDGLPDKILALYNEHGELTCKEVIALLELDVSVRGVRVAFVVAWQQVEKQLINAETLL